MKRRAFKDIKVVSATIHKQARDYFEKHGVAHYWDLCLSTSVLLEEDGATSV